MGFLPDLGADFHRQSLFEESWTCVISNDHPMPMTIVAAPSRVWLSSVVSRRVTATQGNPGALKLPDAARGCKHQAGVLYQLPRVGWCQAPGALRRRLLRPKLMLLVATTTAPTMATITLMICVMTKAGNTYHMCAGAIHAAAG